MGLKDLVSRPFAQSESPTHTHHRSQPSRSDEPSRNQPSRDQSSREQPSRDSRRSPFGFLSLSRNSNRPAASSATSPTTPSPLLCLGPLNPNQNQGQPTEHGSYEQAAADDAAAAPIDNSNADGPTSRIPRRARHQNITVDHKQTRSKSAVRQRLPSRAPDKRSNSSTATPRRRRFSLGRSSGLPTEPSSAAVEQKVVPAVPPMPQITYSNKQANLFGALPALNTDFSTLSFDFAGHWKHGSLSAESVHFAENLSQEDLSLFLLWYLYYDVVSAPPSSARDWYGQLPPEVVRGMIRLGRELDEGPEGAGTLGKEKARLPNRLVCTCADLNVCSIDLMKRVVRFSRPDAMRFPERANLFSKHNAVEVLPRCWEHEELPPVRAAKRNSQASASGTLLRTPRAAAWEDVAEKLRKDRLTAERLRPREGGIWEAYKDTMVEKLRQFEACVVEPALEVEYALMNGKSARTMRKSGAAPKQMRIALLQRWEE
ncbi:hypothetical protein LTS18_010902, partial [Coniosporium uncinatum]